MFYIRILIFIGVILLVYLFFQLFKLYKRRNYVVRCNACGCTDTVLKNNDTEEKFYSYEYHNQGWIKYKIHNPPSFVCNKCKKEYSISNGKFVRKSKKNPK